MSDDYVEEIKQLTLEWPPERIRETILGHLRGSCEWAKKRKLQLESENAEARRKGISYAQRKKFTKEIDAVQGLFEKWRDRGVQYKRTAHTLTPFDFVKQEDMYDVQHYGFEEYIKRVVTTT